MRRQRGKSLLEACPGNWRRPVIVHRCRGCCASREEAVEFVFKLLIGVSFHVLPTPCMVKWLSLWTLVCDLIFMASFHSVLVDGLRFAFDLTVTRADDDVEVSDLSEAEALGLPITSPEMWHRQERRRAMKVMRWIENPSTLHNLMLFLHVAGPVMKLHYTLFKRAQHSPFDDSQKNYVFNLCDPRNSVAVKILEDRTGTCMLRSGSGRRWLSAGSKPGWSTYRQDRCHGDGLASVRVCRADSAGSVVAATHVLGPSLSEGRPVAERFAEGRSDEVGCVEYRLDLFPINYFCTMFWV